MTPSVQPYRPCVAYLKPLAKQHPNNPEIEPLTRTQILMAMGVTAIMLLVVSKLWLHFSSGSLLPIRWNPTALVLGVSIGLGVTGASAIVYRLWPGYQRSAYLYQELLLKPLVWPDLIWLGLLPGLSEELLFRGLMLPAVGLNFTGVLVSSLCFGILHMIDPENWAYVVWATVVGMLLGFSAVYTGNLLVPIVAHIVTNLVSSCLWKLSVRNTGVT